MSRSKAAKIIALEGADRHVWYNKRNLRLVWKALSHDDWIEFCKKMADWFLSDAPDEWDDAARFNKARKAKSDKAALKRVVEEREKEREKEQ